MAYHFKRASSRTCHGALFALLAIAASPATAAAPAAWKPDRPIELVATNAPGGGADRILRIMAKVMQDGRLADVPIAVINKAGAGGSIAYTYVSQHSGNGHYIVLGNKSILTNNLVGQGLSFTEMTPVAKLFNEYIAVTVRPDSTIKTGNDLIERLKKDPTSLNLGIASSFGNISHQGVAAPFRLAGIDAKKVRTPIFPSGGAATTALFGGHVDVVPITLAFATSLMRSGQVRIIAVTATNRLPGVLADIPTWREQGYDVVVTNWRGFLGPKGMTAPQVAYWEDTLRRLVENEEWKKELEINYWSADFMSGADMRKFLEKDNAEARAFLVDIGLVK
jgi:putative tricarboxylic transport membrane protein